MEKLNSSIEDMYNELLADDNSDVKQKSFDFSSIRDNFRQHIHNRRSMDSTDLVLLDDQLIRNLQALKTETFSLIQKFQSMSSTNKQSSNENTFRSFDEFVNFVVNEQEILNSEQWKLEAIFNYIMSLHLDDTNCTVQGSQRI